MYPVFDSHTHTYPEAIAAKAVEGLDNFYHFPFRIDGEGTYAHLSRSYRELGAKGFLLFCVATNAKQVPHVNDSVAALRKRAEEEGFEAVGFGAMHQEFEGVTGELARCRAMGLVGVKLHPDIQREDVDSPKWNALYAEMERTGMILYLHAGDCRPEYRYSEPQKIKKVALRYPKLKIVAAHLGGYGAWKEAETLWGTENVFYDCSSVFPYLPAEEVVRLIRGCGADRVMYGSDYPMPNLRAHLDEFLALPLTEDERKEILYDNAKRLLGF